jgi:hypothetical protein
MSGVRLVDDTTGSGNRVVRAVDGNDIAVAAAQLFDGRWIVSTYLPGPPAGPLETRNEADARAWVQWIGEQIAASKNRGATS